VLWLSPPCEEYSRAKTTGERDLKTADEIAKACLRLIDTLKPKYWVLENPTGLLVPCLLFLCLLSFCFLFPFSSLSLACAPTQERHWLLACSPSKSSACRQPQVCHSASLGEFSLRVGWKVRMYVYADTSRHGQKVACSSLHRLCALYPQLISESDVTSWDTMASMDLKEWTESTVNNVVGNHGVTF
jgi:hypothetical protein